MIQRWTADSELGDFEDDKGDYVLHTDHLAAVAALEGENAGLIKLTSDTLARMGAAIEARVTLEEECAKLRESQCGCLAVQFGKCRFSGQTNNNISVEFGRIAAKVGT